MWLDSNDYRNQKYKILRLFAPEDEKILLDFNPLKMSNSSGWNPMWEEWHCYAVPLRIYRQDYELLLPYFDKVFPTKDAFDGSSLQAFDVCSDNWIGKEDWLRIMSAMVEDMKNITDDRKAFMTAFLKWLNKALAHTMIIVVEGNL